MSTTQKGTDFELRVFQFISNELQSNRLPANPFLSQIFHQKGYWSPQRKGTIKVDVSIEAYLPGKSDISTLWIFECKDLGRKVTADDVEELHSKKNQIAHDSSKAFLVTTNALQKGALNFAEFYKIGVLRLFPGNRAEYKLSFGFVSKLSPVLETLEALTDPGFTSHGKDFYAISNKHIHNTLGSLLNGKGDEGNKLPENYSSLMPVYTRTIFSQEETLRKTRNKTLFSFIRYAYEYIKSRESEQELSEEVLERLYIKPLQSVFRRSDPDNKKHFSVTTGYVDSYTTEDTINQISDEREKVFVNDFHEDQKFNLRELGSDAFAVYLPIHFFAGGSQLETDWGIYISEEGIAKVGFALKQKCNSLFGPPNNVEYENAVFANIAFQILLRHELYHFKIELFTINSELLIHKPIYKTYIANVYALNQYQDSCLEEAFANAAVLNSSLIKGLFYSLYKPNPEKSRERIDWRRAITEEFFDHQPPGYSNYQLERGWPNDFDLPTRYQHRQRAMNFLCNQIITGQSNPTNSNIPFYVFPPENYFLRAENLVPINIVKALDISQGILKFTPKKKQGEKRN